jgi:hypothetical protein
MDRVGMLYDGGTSRGRGWRDAYRVTGPSGINKVPRLETREFMSLKQDICILRDLTLDISHAAFNC